MQLIMYFLQHFGALDVIRALVLGVGVIAILAIVLKRA